MVFQLLENLAETVTVGDIILLCPSHTHNLSVAHPCDQYALAIGDVIVEGGADSILEDCGG